MTISAICPSFAVFHSTLASHASLATLLHVRAVWIYNTGMDVHRITKIFHEASLHHRSGTMNFKERHFWVNKLLSFFLHCRPGIPARLGSLGHWFYLHAPGIGIHAGRCFQLAHVVKTPVSKLRALNPRRLKWWATVKTTANFAEKNKFVSWFVGGLNFQIEHHLFPRISHIHYPAISRIVRETCSQFEIQYNYYPTMLAAVASHYRTMKQLGSKP